MSKGFTTQEVATRVSSRCRWLLLAIGLLAMHPVRAGDGVLVIGDTDRAYFRTFSSSLAAGLGRGGNSISVMDSKESATFRIDEEAFRCIVTVGNEAARDLSAKSLSVPQLHALVTEAFSHELSRQANSQSPRSFLLIDQPVSRLILLASSSMPGRSKLGVIYGPYSNHYHSEVRRQTASAGLQLVEKEITESGQLGGVMSAFNGSADILLTLPDPTVVNEGTAKTLILGAYLENLPLVAYSQALVKAGALMSVHSTPEQLGTQAAELINSSFWNDKTRKEARIYPRYYQVSVNYQVANALQIELPRESELKSRLERLESMQ